MRGIIAAIASRVAAWQMIPGMCDACHWRLAMAGRAGNGANLCWPCAMEKRTRRLG